MRLGTFGGFLVAVLPVCTESIAVDFTLVSHVGSLPLPTPQQLKYQGSINALIHFGMATFFHDGDPGCDASNWNACDPNGGCNSSDVASFAPTNLNVSNWVQSFHDLGATSAVLTAKHGCGFLGWMTNTTLPDGSPYRYHVPEQLQVVQQFVDAVTSAGIGYGFYYSLTNNFYLNVLGHSVQPGTPLPGQATVTQAQYEDLAVAQMTELWTQFGNLTEIWLDGGCGDLCDRVSALVKSTNAVNAVAFNGGGGTSSHPVRWCGTEGGSPSGVPTVWSTAACSWCPDGSGSGDAPNVTGSAWNPSGVDFTLQLGDHWFYTPTDGLHTLSDLVQVYHNSVGANGHLELDFAIDRTGNVAPSHAVLYKQFGDWIRSCYGTPVASISLPASATSVTLTLSSGGSVIDRVSMEEDQTAGQLIITYVVEAQIVGSSAWVPFSAGTTVGAKRIDVGNSPITAAALRWTATSGFGVPTGLILSAYAPDGCKAS